MKMKYPFLVWTLIHVVAFAGCSGSSKPEPQENVQKTVVNEMPTMVLTLLDGSQLNLKDLKTKAVLIFFLPDCDHCQREATQIEENLMAFGKHTLYFITSNPMPEIEKFAMDYKLADHPNVHFGWTPVESVLNNYGSIPTPSIYIYSAEQRLVKKFGGEVPIAELLQYL